MIHGDLGSSNVLWEERNGLPRLSGVIDWDGVKWGDHAEDLAAIWASNGRAVLEKVLAVGAWHDPGLLQRIEAIRGSFALQQAVTAYHDGDEEELADGLSAYR